jgi:hypothetical protein
MRLRLARNQDAVHRSGILPRRSAKELGTTAFLLCVNLVLLLAGNVMDPSSIILISRRYSIPPACASPSTPCTSASSSTPRWKSACATPV